MNNTSVTVSQDKKGTIFDVYPYERINSLIAGGNQEFLARLNTIDQHVENIISKYNAAISGSGRNAD